MKKIIVAVSSIMVAFVLSSCGTKDIQPLRALSDINVGKVNVAEVNVDWSSEYKELIEKEKATLKIKEEELEKLNQNNSKKETQKLAKNKAIKAVKRQQNKVTELEKELIAVPLEVKEAILKDLSTKPIGETEVTLHVVVNSFALTNGGSVLLVGGSDSMTAMVNIIENKTNEKIGEYFITDHDTNAAGGILGLMVRGSDPRGDMVKQFSAKVIEVLYGKES